MTEPMGKLQTDELLAHAGWVRSLARRLVADQASADDLVQETWLRALQSPPKSGHSTSGWLARVAQNVRRRQWRTDARRVEREAQAVARLGRAEHSPDELIAEAEHQQHIGTCVLGLEEPYRTVILRHYWRGETASVIGAASGVSAATVRSQLTRARALLLEFLEREFDGDQAAAKKALTIAAAPMALVTPGALGIAAAPHVSLASTGAETQQITAWLQGAALMKTSTTFFALAALALTLVGAWIAAGSFGERARAGSEAKVGRALVDDSSVQAPVPASQVSPAPAEGVGGRETVDAASSARAGAPDVSLVKSETTSTMVALVVSGDGRPLVGALLRLASLETGAETDVNGEVTLTLLGSDLHSWRGQEQSAIFVLERTGYATQFIRSTPDLGGEVDLGRRVLLPGARITGRVLDVRGQGVEGLRVLAAPIGDGLEPLERRLRGPQLGDGVPETVSGTGGAFELKGLCATSLIPWAQTPGDGWVFGEAVTAVEGELTDGVDLIVVGVDPADAIELCLLDAGGEPLTEATLHIAREGQAFASSRKVHPDERGHVRLLAEARALHDILVEGVLWHLQPAMVRQLMPGSPRLTVRLKESQAMLVSVRDAKTGEAIKDARIYTRGGDLVSYDANAKERSGQAVTAKPETPHVARLRIPAFPFHVDIDHPSFEAAVRGPFDPLDAPSELVVELKRIASLTGRVMSDGRPVADARVELRAAPKYYLRFESYGFRLRMNRFAEASTHSDSEGRFTLGMGRAAECFVIATKDGLSTGEAGPVAVGPSASPDPIEVTMAQGGAISGRLLLREGKSVQGELVAFSRGDGVPQIVRTDAQGAFLAEGLTPGGWRVEHRRLEVETSMMESAVGEPLQPIEWDCHVTDGQTTLFDLDLRSILRTRISGSLVGDSQSFGRWTACLRRELLDTDGSQMRPILVGEDGRFEFDVERGSWRLQLVGPVVVQDGGGGPGSSEIRSAWKLSSTIIAEEDQLSLTIAVEPAPLAVTMGSRDTPLRAVAQLGVAAAGEPTFRCVVGLDGVENKTVTAAVPKGVGRLEGPPGEGEDPGAIWGLIRNIDVPDTGLWIAVESP